MLKLESCFFWGGLNVHFYILTTAYILVYFCMALIFVVRIYKNASVSVDSRDGGSACQQWRI